MTNRRRVIYLGVVLTFILQTLKSFSQSTAYLLSLWAMEFAVLVLIAYEVWDKIVDRRRIKKRTKVLFGLLNRGQELLNGAPSVNYPENVAGWVEQVLAWTKEARTALEGYTAHALASFNHLNIPTVNYTGVSAGAHAHFKELIARLDNLRNIMEKPEVYY